MNEQILLTGRVFDGEWVHKRATIVVDPHYGLISGFGEIGSVQAPRDAKIIAENDITILPGLIDAHVHFFGVPKGHGIMEWATRFLTHSQF